MPVRALSKMQSAGLLLFRQRDKSVQVLLGHPGGPFWSRKDQGAWTIPKGLIGPGESPLSAAQREFAEETGLPSRRQDHSAWQCQATGRQGRPHVGN